MIDGHRLASKTLVQLVSDNPYAPSLVDPVGDAPPSRGWELVDGKLLVEAGAVLPMIDPYSGDTADRMTLMRPVLRPRVLWPRYLFLGSLGFVFLFGYLGFPAVASYFSIPILVAIIGAIGTSLIGSSVMVHVFLTRQTRRRQALTYWLLLGTVVLMLSLMFLAPDFSGEGDWILNVIAAASLVALFAAIMIRWRQRRLYWRKGPDHRKEMKGLHPRALELLAETVAGQRA
jgi:hypothetical protein